MNYCSAIRTMHSNSASCHDDEWRLLENTLYSFCFSRRSYYKNPKVSKDTDFKELKHF